MLASAPSADPAPRLRRSSRVVIRRRRRRTITITINIIIIMIILIINIIIIIIIIIIQIIPAIEDRSPMFSVKTQLRTPGGAEGKRERRWGLRATCPYSMKNTQAAREVTLGAISEEM